MTELLPCPFCGGNAKVSFKDYRFGGQNYCGDKKISYRVQVICNKCKSRGMPIITPMLIAPNPYDSQYYRLSSKNMFALLAVTYSKNKNDEMFEPYIERAIKAWNRRTSNDNRKSY